MKRARPSTTVLMFLLSTTVLAQSLKDAAHALRDKLGKDEHVLRGFPEDATTHWKWDGTAWAEDEPKGHALSAMAVESIKVKGTSLLMIQGEQAILGRGSTGKATWLMTGGKVEIVVDFGPSVSSAQLDHVSDVLFFPDVGHALAALPEGLQKAILEPAASKPPSPPKPGGSCKPPKLLPGGMDGVLENVHARFRIETDGTTHDIWILVPGSSNANDETIAMASKMRFTPEICDGVPTASTLNLNLHNEIQIH